MTSIAISFRSYVLGGLLGVAPACLGESEAATARDYADLSIEELMHETITSVSKRAETLADAPAAVSIITNDNLRRMGVTSIPEALRLVPGMEVGAANVHEWAVSARGFNQVYSNKLLVLIDGRAVYSPLFGGVFWDVQQPMLDDVDRIEVIRGPGATIWGANAVNGVVNVVTRSARETRGSLAYAAVGDDSLRIAGARQGFQFGPQTFARVFASYAECEDLPRTGGGAGRGDCQSRHAGLRLDSGVADDRTVTWQIEGTSAKGGSSNNYNLSTLARWTRTLGPGSAVELQGYVDRIHTSQPVRGGQTTDTVDVTAQHSWSVAKNYDVVWGAGARLFRGKIIQTSSSVFVRHPEFERHLFSGFVQARKQFPTRATAVIGGVKVEHNSYTGFEVQPTLRLVYKPAPSHTVWAAVSRAVRTPGEVEANDTLGIVLGAPIVGPGGRYYLPAVLGNPDLQSEILTDYQIGGRFQLSPRASLDVAAFFDAYERLILYGGIERFEVGQPFGWAEMTWRNLYRARGAGGEVVLNFAPTDHGRIGLSYSYINLHVLGESVATSPTAFVRPPRHQVGLSAALEFGARTTCDLRARHVGAMRGTPAYTTADLRIGYQLSPTLELSLVGQNLLQPRHLEQAPIALTESSEVPRRFYFKLTFRD